MTTLSFGGGFAWLVGISQQIAECSGASITGALHDLSFDPEHGFFQRQSLARDFGFGKWWVHVAELGQQRSARSLIKAAPAFAGRIGIEARDGFNDQRVIVTHFPTSSFVVTRARRARHLDAVKILRKNRVYLIQAKCA